MRQFHPLALQYVHIPACFIKFPPPPPTPTSNPSDQSSEEFSPKKDICEQQIYRKVQQDLGIRKISKASELGLNDDSVTFLDEEDEGGANMIVCSHGNCKFLNTRFVLERNREKCDGEPVQENQCVIGTPKEEQGCKPKTNDENNSSKKVTFLIYYSFLGFYGIMLAKYLFN